MQNPEAEKSTINTRQQNRRNLSKMKTQTIRLVDVFVLGPFMIWAGYELAKKKDFAGMVLAGAGLATMAYNWENYKEVQNNAAIESQ